MLKREDIGLRDPFILLHEGKYYMYGTRNKTVWGPADGFDVYCSEDLENWSEPVEIFHNDGSFWATECYWAPECVYHDGKFYLVTTFSAPDKCKRLQVLVAESPLGPFVPLTDEPLTPADWNAIDGTVYEDERGELWLIFSHSLPEEPRGAICCAKLAPDFTHIDGEIKNMFFAGDAPWAQPIPFAKAEFGLDGDVYLSDGPYVIRDKKGRLQMIWSSWSEQGYAIGLAVSDNGSLKGPWRHLPEPISRQDGGHGMIFRDKNGELKLALHSPNDTPNERLSVQPCDFLLAD